jgi:hypothetical protein
MIKRIAGETEEKSLERDAIVRRLETLENGARVCKQYAKRPQCELSPHILIRSFELTYLATPSSEERTESSDKAKRKPGKERESIIPFDPSSNNSQISGQPPSTQASGSLKTTSRIIGVTSAQRATTKHSGSRLFHFPPSESRGPFSSFLSESKNPTGIFGAPITGNNGGPTSSTTPQPTSLFGSAASNSGASSKATGVFSAPIAGNNGGATSNTIPEPTSPFGSVPSGASSKATGVFSAPIAGNNGGATSNTIPGPTSPFGSAPSNSGTSLFGKPFGASVSKPVDNTEPTVTTGHGQSPVPTSQLVSHRNY